MAGRRLQRAREAGQPPARLQRQRRAEHRRDLFTRRYATAVTEQQRAAAAWEYLRSVAAASSGAADRMLRDLTDQMIRLADEANNRLARRQR